MTVLITLLLLAVLLLLKGFFSGSEIGFVSADRVRLRSRAAQGDKGAALAQRLLSDPPRLLTTTLLGTNFATVMLATVGTILMVGLFPEHGEWLAVLVFTPLFLILGEIVPKSIYQQRANVLVPWLAYPLFAVQILLWPLVVLFTAFARLAARLVGGQADPTSAIRDLFHGAVRSAEQSATAAAFSKGQVRNVLRFAQLTAQEAMLPLSDLRAFPRDAAMADVAAYRIASGERLIPIYAPGAQRTQISGVAKVESWDVLDPSIADRTLSDFESRHATVQPLHPVSEVITLLHADPDLVVIVADEEGHGFGLITLRLLVRRTLGAGV